MSAYGDVTMTYGKDGVEVAKYAYDAWGHCSILLDSSGIATANPFRYRGYYYDADLGLYYLKTRYYDPETGRFISPDSPKYLTPEILNGLNLYAYCGNNPVMNIDPNRNVWKELIPNRFRDDIQERISTGTTSPIDEKKGKEHSNQFVEKSKEKNISSGIVGEFYEGVADFFVEGVEKWKNSGGYLRIKKMQGKNSFGGAGGLGGKLLLANGYDNPWEILLGTLW